jgi:DNA repair exonuclease SbcCD nuclease subunit
MKDPTAILTADWHIRADTPRSRTDDFIAAMWSKVQFITELAIELDVPIFLAGDIGTRSQWPNWLIEKFMAYIEGVSVISIPGQHDLPEHNLDLYRKSAYGILVQARYIHISKPFPIDQFPYGVPMEQGKADYAMAHQMVIEDKPEWPGQVATSGKALLKKYPEYKMILTGDNHKPFVVKYEKRILVNPGSMMRTTADQIDHQPRIYLWRMKDNAVEPMYLPIVPDVLDRSHIDSVKLRDKRIDAYTSRLSEKYELGFSFEKNLEAHFGANRTRRPVKDRIWEACER